jgi:hypothetical protein
VIGEITALSDLQWIDTCGSEKAKIRGSKRTVQDAENEGGVLKLGYRILKTRADGDMGESGKLLDNPA